MCVKAAMDVQKLGCDCWRKEDHTAREDADVCEMHCYRPKRLGKLRERRQHQIDVQLAVDAKREVMRDTDLPELAERCHSISQGVQYFFRGSVDFQHYRKWHRTSPLVLTHCRAPRRTTVRPNARA